MAKKANLDRNGEPGSSDPTSLSELGSRIEKVLALYDSRKSAAEQAGISVDQLAAYVQGRNAPAFPVIARLARGRGVRLDWLATGEGEMFAGGAPRGGNPDQVADYEYIPLYDVRAAAGGGAIAEEGPVIDDLAFKAQWVRSELHASPRDLYLIYVDGESMEPTLRPGDVILVNHQDTGPSRDGIYVLRMDDALLVKRLQRLPGGKIRASSDNAAYQPFELDGNSDIAIIGRVVWSGRRM